MNMLVPLYVPMLLVKYFFHQLRPNVLLAAKREFSGKKIVASSRDYDFPKIKACAKKLKLSLNDFVTSCLAVCVKRYFKMKGDDHTNEINICIPANIRFDHYKSAEKLLIENKLSFTNLYIPLTSSIQESIQLIPKATEKLRSSFTQVYAAYFSILVATNLLPYAVVNWYLNYTSRVFTFSFSNTPGILKPIFYKGRRHLKMQSYIQAPGKCGMLISCLSFVDKLKVTCTVDQSVMEDP